MEKNRFNPNEDFNRKKKNNKKKKVFKKNDEFPILKKNPNMESSEKEFRSTQEYFEIDIDFHLISETFEKISQTKVCNLEDSDVLNSGFAKCLVRMFNMNKCGLHEPFFKSLKTTDYDSINETILSILNSSSTLEDMCINLEQGKKTINQVEEYVNNAFNSAFKKDSTVCIGKRYEEFIHITTMQVAMALTWIAARDIKSTIKYNSNEPYILDDTELAIICDLNSILSLTYPFHGNFELINLFQVEKKDLSYQNKVTELMQMNWMEKADWINNKLEEIQSTKKIFDLEEKKIFEKVLDMLVNELSEAQNGITLEETKKRARQEVLNPYFNAMMSYLNGDEKMYNFFMEAAKKGLLRVIYVIEYQKSNGKNEKK
jgi:hypothetical protein